MEYLKPKIQFYKVRAFGEKLNVSFEFLRETWKPLLKNSVYLILPICLIQAFAMQTYIQSTLSLADGDIAGYTSLLIPYGILVLCALIGSCSLSAMVYSLMQTYDTRENRLEGITFADFKATFLKNAGKMAKMMLFFLGVGLLVVLIIVLFAALSPWSLLATIPVFLIGFVAVMIPLSLFSPIYLFEDIPFGVAFKKALRHGFSVWGELFLIMFIFGLLSGIISGVTSIPWYIVVFVGQMFALVEPDTAFNTALWYRTLSYLLAIVQAYGAYLGAILGAVGLAFQYFHIREQKEGISVKADIANFDRL
jgi:hypothetical protein